MQVDDGDIGKLLGEHFAFCSDRYGLHSPPGAGCHPCRDLLDGGLLGTILDRYAARYPEADPRASASFWTMYYFSHLMITPIVLWLRHGRVLDLSLDAMSVRIDPETNLPLGFTVGDLGADRRAETIFGAMEGVIEAHAAPLIAELAGRGLSARLLWSNLAVYVDWVAREIGIHQDPYLTEKALPLVESEFRPDGRRNPLFNLLRRHSEEGCAEITRRRVCCLRYILPGIPGCGMICPLPQGRV